MANATDPLRHVPASARDFRSVAASLTLKNDELYETLEHPETDTIESQLQADTLQFVLRVKRLGIRKAFTHYQADTTARAHNASAAAIFGGSKLIDDKHPKYKAVTAILSRARSLVKGYTYDDPSQAGSRLINQGRVADLVSELDMLYASLSDAVAELDADWSGIVEAQRVRRGDLFRESDYPASLSRCFDLSWSINPPPSVPNYLRQHHPEIYSRMNDQLSDRYRSVIDKFETDMVGGLDAIVSGLVSTLGNQLDGKSKRFDPSGVETLREFLQVFRNLNLRSHAELTTLCGDLEKLIDGIKPSDLRNDPSLVRSVSDSLGGLNNRVQSILVDLPSRKIR